MEETKKVASQIAANGAVAVRLAKMVINAGFNMELTRGLFLGILCLQPRFYAPRTRRRG